MWLKMNLAKSWKKDIIVFKYLVAISYNVWWLHDVAKSNRKHSIKQPIKQVQKQH
jgi:hypothetical protein